MQSRTVIWILLPALILPVWILAAEGNVANGKQVFSNRCIVCHGESGEGKEAIAKAMGATMKPLGSLGVQALSDENLKKGIVEGRGKMKPLPMSDQDVADVIAYLRTLKK